MWINWRELKAAFLALQTFPQLNNMRILIRTDNTTSMAYMNKQGYEVITINEISKKPVEVVSTTKNYNTVHSCARSEEHSNRPQVTAPIPQEQLDDTAQNIPRVTTLSGRKRRRPICRQKHQQLSKSGKRYQRRVYHSVEPTLPTVFESISESNQQVSSEVGTRAGAQYRSTTPTGPSGGSPANTNSNMVDEQQKPGTHRMERISYKERLTNWSENAQKILISSRLEDNATNWSYKNSQFQFMDWARNHRVEADKLNHEDFISFLSDMLSGAGRGKSRTE
ncbi:uncharacterized protein EV154DRAFT_592922 [Mucor mucedo]|uniref:uncharacterized protein n=1 Tax=Mucor mucedo TaxID=29922 RepID=UPI00221F4949|nr:uncharacterized protein EV154DRAFT_592922 [Mucor mucedo]KAI7888890.1 hypothetical protein EV154DRAFT_592922 [Mucor mucedo]